MQPIIHPINWARSLLLQLWKATSGLPRCQNPELSSVNKGAFALALFLCFGIVGSYIPQHHRIISRGSSQGLSPWFVLLGATSSTCAFAAMSSLPITQGHVRCCREISGFACFAGLLTALQIALQWLCFFIIFALFNIYLPRQDPENPTSTAPPRSRSGIRQKATIVSIVVLLHLFISIAFEGLLYARFPQHLMRWANINGTVSPLLAVVQYLPQIWTTFRLKSAYSLSIPMMIMQVPGSFIFALSIWLDVGWKGWSVWLMYCITGFMQTILLVLAVKYAWDARQRGKGMAKALSGDGADDLQPDEGGLDDEARLLPRAQNADAETPLGNGTVNRRSKRVWNKRQSDDSAGETTPLLQKGKDQEYTASISGHYRGAAQGSTGNNTRRESDDLTPKAIDYRALGYFPSSSSAMRLEENNDSVGNRAIESIATRSELPLGADAASVESQESYVTAIMYNDGGK